MDRIHSKGSGPCEGCRHRGTVDAGGTMRAADCARPMVGTHILARCLKDAVEDQPLGIASSGSRRIAASHGHQHCCSSIRVSTWYKSLIVAWCLTFTTAYQLYIIQSISAGFFFSESHVPVFVVTGKQLLTYPDRCAVISPYAEFQLRPYLQSSDLDPTFHSSY